MHSSVNASPRERGCPTTKSFVAYWINAGRIHSTSETTRKTTVKKKNPPLSIERAAEVVCADFEYGKLTWKTTDANRNAIVGEEAGNIGAKGYRRVSIDNGLYLVHRVIFALAHGRWPAGRLDHINRIRLDNRLENLRECSASENRMNSSVRSDCVSGLKGASFDRRTGRYKAVIRMTGRGGRRKYLGRYKTAEEAHRAFCKASQERSSAFFSETTKPET